MSCLVGISLGKFAKFEATAIPGVKEMVFDALRR